ncbi:hypothetical protein GCM10027266_20180 [Arenimonas alkanexedens]
MIFTLISLPPDIKIVFEDRPGYLYARVSGPRDNREISLAYWALVAEQVRLRKTTRLMVVEALGEREGEHEVSFMIDALIEMGLDQIQVAFVVDRIDILGAMEHGEILAIERGANGRVFGSATVAERWLRHGGQ